MKILLCVSGSISAYKALDLTRGLVNNGHQVKIILTTGALKFVVPEVFSYLGTEEVYLSDSDFKNKNVLHVDLARWCDCLVIAPLSANTLSRLARGEASDLLTSVFLALESHKPICLFPAMNTHMLSHPFTQENLASVLKLKTLQNVFISATNSGILACAEMGLGKLPTVEEIITLIPTLRAPFTKTSKLKKIVISTGATIAPLDPVRYLTNSSSGITGFHLAVSALKQGYEVVVIAGKNATAQLDLLVKHPNFQLQRVVTVSDMYAAIKRETSNAQVYLSAAAISDIEFDVTLEKVKKEHINQSIKVNKAIDILKSIIDSKPHGLKIVGFAAETNLSDEVLTKKFNSKPVDLLVGTKVDNGLVGNNEVSGFNTENATYRFMQNNMITSETELKKSELGEYIFQKIGL